MNSDEIPVIVERAEAVARVVMNRPTALNALDASMKTALVTALARIAADATVRAVILTGAGKGFCVGQDLAEHERLLAEDATTAFETVRRHYAPIVTTLATMPKPVVAAVNGTCVGAGLALALACDLRVWSSQAALATAFTGVGLTCDSGLSATLARSVGEARAKELVLLGTRFTPEQAVQWGLGGEVVEPDAVASTAGALARRLAAGPTVAYAESKLLIAAAFEPALASALEDEASAQARCGLTEDHRDAVTAFRHKQTPVFFGR